MMKLSAFGIFTLGSVSALNGFALGNLGDSAMSDARSAIRLWRHACEPAHVFFGLSFRWMFFS
jgi:hypothetical protein